MRYFFDVSEGGELTKDLVGTELESHSVIPREARRLALDIARDLKAISDDFLIEVFVNDGAGKRLLRHALQLTSVWV